MDDNPGAPEDCGGDDLTLDEVEGRLILACVTLAAAGSVPAIKEALGFIAQRRRAEAAERHQAQLEEMRGKPSKLVHYLATLGQSKAEIVEAIGRPLSKPLLAAMRRGQKDRQVEIRAIELDQVRAGHGMIRGWMRE